MGPLRTQANALKADRAINALDRISYQLPSALGVELRFLIEQLMLSWDGHALRQLWALRVIANADAVLPAWLVDAAVRLCTNQDPRSRLGLHERADAVEVRTAAAAAAMRYMAYANAALVPPIAIEVAEVLRISCTLIARLEAAA